MSLPNFPDSPRPPPSHSPIVSELPSYGAGDHLPVWLLALCGSFTAVATGVSIMSITLQLKNYRKPMLQRAVVRIMVMVPLYAISSLIAIFSLEAAFFIDAIRDLYEAFVIYTFLQLLITYLGGERSLLILLHGRPPIPHPFPVSLFLRPMDVSDPWSLLSLKRGVLQYVQVKPLLVLATIILKLTGKYREGDFAIDSGYTYISIVYNTSICLSLYCLAMFWVAVNNDLKPFRPVPKFLCVKGILFFSFWQSIGISFLVAVKAIKRVGPYTDPEHMSLALVDSLVCFEMPIFAIAHQYAFQASDYIDQHHIYAARLPFIYAFRDAFGFKDVWEDTKDTFKGRGVSYQAYEPAEGGLHYGLGRQRRIRAGLRYSKGGKAKYWMPMPGDEARNKGETGPLSALKRRVDVRLAAREGYAPLLPQQAARVVRDDPNGVHEGTFGGIFDSDSSDSDAPSISFHSVDEDEDTLYERARRIGYAGFPNVDVSKEEKQKRLWQAEEGILAGKWNRSYSNDLLRPPIGDRGTSASSAGSRRSDKSRGKGKGKNDKGKGKKAVYGAWADKVTQVDRQPHAPNGHSTNPSGEGDWLYDGDNERPDAWHHPSNNAHEAKKGENQNQLRWTRKQLHKIKEVSDSLKIPHQDGNNNNPSKSPFSLGEDESSESEIDTDDSVSPASSSKPLPSDAVDLVKDDLNAVEKAREREIRRGEPQTKAPQHVYKKTLRDSNEQKGEGRIEGIERVYISHDDLPSSSTEENVNGGGNDSEVVERVETSIAISPPKHAMSLDIEDNPWA
ncbi:hypothetical protein I204_03782 [Kwoniella mangroviensis CBS 8886]|uniref:uncharacterized protein n=1 Tax=Kwoniella mangroviensis CBS 8507 TaxID=1296122 RepID=UPI00080D72A0|nr:uncharacterized protein I203_02926 [Kwoniella mangroviensis CBS 8507]OCF68262.1 hypothetical protein I203_02926 [Kwoniella mangroviensis CBS 8507]OCF74938.1 hypothetical protein I204_03782 [Kwoniella mangroviensis CBS 8886]